MSFFVLMRGKISKMINYNFKIAYYIKIAFYFTLSILAMQSHGRNA